MERVSTANGVDFSNLILYLTNPLGNKQEVEVMRLASRLIILITIFLIITCGCSNGSDVNPFEPVDNQQSGQDVRQPLQTGQSETLLVVSTKSFATQLMKKLWWFNAGR